MPYDLYDFTDKDGESIIRAWRRGLTPRSRGALDNKLGLLALHGMDLPPKLLAGPIKKTKHIYKLIIHADVNVEANVVQRPICDE